MLLEKAVYIIRDSLKKTYMENPNAIWDFPCIGLIDKNNELKIIDGKYTDQQIADFLKHHFSFKEIVVITIGRMLVEYGNVIDPNTGKPVIKKKAIVVYGKNIQTNDSMMIVLPCKEHFDTRELKVIENDKETDTIVNATLGGSPDIERSLGIGNKKYWFKARFGKEEVYSSKKGYKVVEDPLIKLLGV